MSQPTIHQDTPHAGAPAALSFDHPAVLSALLAASAADLDAVDFGVIGMTLEGTVCLYSRWEAARAGLDPSRVIGKHFFTAVGPCTNNPMVAMRFLSEPELDSTIDYTFSFRLRPSRVKLRLLRSARSPLMYLLVTHGGEP